MGSMKRNGGGQLLLRLLSILAFTLILGTCENKGSSSLNPLTYTPTVENENYRIDVLPPKESSLLPFSFEISSAVKSETLVIPVTCNAKVKVKYKRNFSFFIKADIPGSPYEFTSMETTNKWIELKLPKWEVVISILPINSDLPPYRVKINFQNNDEVEIEYPDPIYYNGYLSVTDVTFPIEGYRTILKTSDGFTSANSPIINGEFHIPAVPSEKFSYLVLYSESDPFLPVFTIPIDPASFPLHLNLLGEAKKEVITIFESGSQKLPYFLSVKGDSVYTLKTSSATARGEVSGSLLITSVMYQIKLLSGHYKLFMTPSSTSGYASFVTNVHTPVPPELHINFPPSSLLNLTITDYKGTPLSGAEVDLEPVPVVEDLQVLPVSGFTNREGKVTLPIDASFPFTFYLIRVLPPDRYKGPGTLIIISSQSLLTMSTTYSPFMIALPPFTLHRVKIIDAEGKPVSNAVILLTNKVFGLNIFKGVTDSKGIVDIPLIARP